MKSVVLANQKETIVGLRLAGIKGELINDVEEVLPKVRALINDPSVGTIMITQALYNANQEGLLEIKLKLKEKMIIKIPGFNEGIEESLIYNHIRDSVGLKL
ncbi:MAG TPA: V-type ATP synthase subunit F [Clostridia bacterium]|nr:V-type ATP synthase subunit F [Clostridia bacterium]